jgi:membrane protease YdiL (CAAX protease family)
MQTYLFPDIKRTSGRILLLFIAVDYLLVSLIILLFSSRLLDPIVQANGGLINRTQMGKLPLMLIVVGLVQLGLGKLRAPDLGLVRSRLLAGVVFTAGLWLVVQVVQLACGLAATGTVTAAPEWSQLGVLAITGGLLGQLFGNALYEDIAYRGFLLPQVSAKLGDRWPGRPLLALVVALLSTQALFALRHIPIRVLTGYDLADMAASLPITMSIGVLYGLLYLRTKNLFLVIGVHALVDAPPALFAATFLDSSTLTLLIAMLALLAWTLISRKEGKRSPVGNALSPQHS